MLREDKLLGEDKLLRKDKLFREDKLFRKDKLLSRHENELLREIEAGSFGAWRQQVAS